MHELESAQQRLRTVLFALQGPRHGDGGAIGRAISRLTEPQALLPLSRRRLDRLTAQRDAAQLLMSALDSARVQLEQAQVELPWLSQVLQDIALEPPFPRPGQPLPRKDWVQLHAVLPRLTLARDELAHIWQQAQYELEGPPSTSSAPRLEVDDLIKFKRLMVVIPGQPHPRRALLHDLGELLWESIHALRHPDEGASSDSPTFETVKRLRRQTIEHEVYQHLLLGTNSALEPIRDRFRAFFERGIPLLLLVILAFHQGGIPLLAQHFPSLDTLSELSPLHFLFRVLLTSIPFFLILVMAQKLLLAAVGMIGINLGPLRLLEWRMAVTDAELLRVTPAWGGRRDQATLNRVFLNSVPQVRLLEGVLSLPLSAEHRQVLLERVGRLPGLRAAARTLLLPFLPSLSESVPERTQELSVDNSAILSVLCGAEGLSPAQEQQLLAQLLPEHAAVIAAVMEEALIPKANDRIFTGTGYAPERLRAAVAGEVWDEGTLAGVQHHLKAHPALEGRVFFSEAYVRGANAPGVPNKSRTKPKATNTVISRWKAEAQQTLQQAHLTGQPLHRQLLPDTFEIFDAEDVPNRLQFISIAIVFEAISTTVTYLLEHAELSPGGPLDTSRLHPATLKQEAPELWRLARRWRVDPGLALRLTRTYARLRERMDRLAPVTSEPPSPLQREAALIRQAFLQVYPTASDFVRSELEVRSVPSVVQGILELMPYGRFAGKSDLSCLDYRNTVKRGLAVLGWPFPLDGTTNSFRLKTMTGWDPRTLQPIPRKQLQDALFELQSEVTTYQARALLGTLKTFQPLDLHPADDIVEDAHIGMRAAERGLRVFLMTDPETQTFEEPLPTAPGWFAQRSRWITLQPQAPLWAASHAYLVPVLAFLGAAVGGATGGAHPATGAGVGATLLGFLAGALLGRAAAAGLTRLEGALGISRSTEDLEDRFEQLGMVGMGAALLVKSGFFATFFGWLGCCVAIAYQAGVLTRNVLLPFLETRGFAAPLHALGLLAPLKAVSGWLIEAIPADAWFVTSPLAGVGLLALPLLLQTLATMGAVLWAGLDDKRLVAEGVGLIQETLEALRRGVAPSVRAWTGPQQALARLDAHLLTLLETLNAAQGPGEVMTALQLQHSARSLEALLVRLKLPRFPAQLLQEEAKGLDGTPVTLHILETLRTRLLTQLQRAVQVAVQGEVERLEAAVQEYTEGRVCVGAVGQWWGMGLYALGWWGLQHETLPVRILGMGLLLGGLGLLLGGLRTALRGEALRVGPVWYFRLCYLGRAWLMPFYYLQMIPAMHLTLRQLWRRLDNIWPKTEHGSDAPLDPAIMRAYWQQVEAVAVQTTWSRAVARLRRLKRTLSLGLSHVRSQGRSHAAALVVLYLLVPISSVVGTYALSALHRFEHARTVARELTPIREAFYGEASANPLWVLAPNQGELLEQAYTSVFRNHPEYLLDWIESDVATWQQLPPSPQRERLRAELLVQLRAYEALRRLPAPEGMPDSPLPDQLRLFQSLETHQEQARQGSSP